MGGGAGDENEPVEIGGMVIGAILLIIAMFLPFIVVRYAPAGGSGMVNGHRINAFDDTITGWQFAQAARYSHILLFFAFVAVRLVMFLSKDAAESLAKALGVSSAYGHAVVHVTFIVGWVALIGLGVAFGSLAMPPGGESGILPAFHADPLSPGYQQAVKTTPAPGLSASLGAGWWLILAGIMTSALSMWLKVILSVFGLVAALALFAVIDALAGWHLNSLLIHWLDGLR